MAELTVPQIDFSSLGQLPAIYKQNRNEMSLANLGRGLADGTVDYRQAAAQTAGMGDITHTLQFLALAEQQKKQGLEREAATEFGRGVQGIFGAQPNPAPPTSSPMPVPGAREPIGGSAAIPNVAPRAPVPSTSKVWGDAEAEAAGLYEPAPPRLASTAAPTVAPRPAPSVSPAAAPQVGAQHVPALLQALSNPNLPSGQKETAKLLLGEAFKNMKEPEKIQTLRALRADPSLLDVEMALKKAGSTNVTVGSEKEFDKTLDQGQAKRWNGYIETGQAARKKLVDIDTMREISQRLGSQGAAANIKEAIGPYAEALGINIDGVSDVQAYSQVIQRLAPQQRAEGSGSTSDIEFKGFLKSLPTLAQHPAAREVGLNTMEALTRDDMARGDIATRLATREITRKQAEQELRALPDPMKGFSDWRKANPGLYGQALKGQGAAPTAAKPMKFTPQETDQSLSNAKAAISANPAARNAILKKLRDNGLPTDGL